MNPRTKLLIGPEHPGKLIHIDIKKLGRNGGVGHRITGDCHRQSRKRGTGWEYLHVAIDDASRLDFTAMMPDEKKESAVVFLDAAIAWFKAHGVVTQRVMTDNSSAHKSKAFATAIAAQGLMHKRTRPYTPKTNGKAERFIQTSIRGWAYGTAFQTSAERTCAMHPWLHNCNIQRPHSAPKGLQHRSQECSLPVSSHQQPPTQFLCSRQKQQVRAGFANGAPDGLAFVAAEMVQHHDIVGSQRRGQGLVDVGAEPLAVDGLAEDHGCNDGITAELGDAGHRLSMSVRYLDEQPLAASRASATICWNSDRAASDEPEQVADLHRRRQVSPTPPRPGDREVD